MSRTTKHTLAYSMEIFGQERDISIVFNFTPGYPSTREEPGEGPQIEILKVSVKTSTKGKPEVWADGGQWLADLVQESIDDGGPDSSQFADERRDYEIGIEETKAEMRREDAEDRE